MTRQQTERELLITFLSSLQKLQNVERGSIWVKRGEAYHCIEALGHQSDRVKGIRIEASEASIVGWVIENGRMTIARPEEDDRHFEAIESGLDVKSTLILCFPMVMTNGRVYGAIELIDTSTGGRRLNLRREYVDLIENLVKIGSIALSHFMDYHLQLEENRKLREAIDHLQEESPLIGESPSFLDVLRKVESYAKVDFSVLITGESGTGKDLIAREIHRRSARWDRPYMVQNCSAIPDSLLESELFGHKKGAFTGAVQDKIGLFEAANSGTVFLDEIGDMPLHLQARILRVIQNREIKPLGSPDTQQVDVRIISATNQDLTKAIAEQRFREDLFFRLNVLPLQLPPLRERPEDILNLLDFFLFRECRRLGLDTKKLNPGAVTLMRDYHWPGNVREMENLTRRLIVSTPKEVIRAEDVRGHLAGAGHAPKPSEPDSSELTSVSGPDLTSASLVNLTWEEMERRYIMGLLEQYKWNISRAADRAGLNRSTFNSRMRKLGIRKSD